MRAAGRQKATMAGRNPLGQRIPFSLPGELPRPWLVSLARPIELAGFGRGRTFVSFTPFTRATWRRQSLSFFFFFNLQISALILEGPNVPSTPCEYYKTGNSGFGEARV